MPIIHVCDEDLGKPKTPAFALEFPAEETTVREIIRSRVYQEVADYNAGLKNSAPPRRMLVTPTAAESRLNGTASQTSPKSPKPIDWQAQYDLALHAFLGNGFFVLVGDRQAEELDETVIIAPDTEVTFVKLVPLVGG